jgi:hypothetical protein
MTSLPARQSSWIEVLCDGGCGRRLGAYRPAVEAGARVLCTVCHPGYLPFVPESERTSGNQDDEEDSR